MAPKRDQRAHGIRSSHSALETNSNEIARKATSASVEGAIHEHGRQGAAAGNASSNLEPPRSQEIADRPGRNM